jgi:rubrerythrin
MGPDERTVVVHDAAQLAQPSTRRSFLRALGLGGTIVLMPSVFAACTDERSTTGLVPGGASRDLIGGAAITAALDLSTDVGIFNYAYAIEQVAAAFYTQLTTAPAFFSTFASADEQEVLFDIRRNEVAHREFLRAALGSAAIPDLTPNFSSVNFADRLNALNTARMLEDLDIAAYNGAGRYIKNANNLLMAGKIVSVEARHAAALRDLLDTTGTAFADLASLASLGADEASGRDAALPPESVLPLAQPFVQDTITIGVPPT